MNEPKDAILIVDDTPTNLDVLVNCLTESDFEVFVATDGQKALERVKLAKPDLIVLDVMMPGMDGFETCRRLKQDKDTKDIPVIFMTSLTDTVDKVKGFEVGAVDYVTKPIQHEEVLARVTTHLTIRKLHRELQQANERLEQRVAERTAELTQANDSLRESEARFSGILDIAPEAIISSDEFGHIIMFNKGAEAIFNYSQGEVIGKSIDLLIPEKYHKAHRGHIAKFVRSDQTTHRMGERGEVFGRRKNGEIFPAEASISKLQLDGQLILTEILRDITKRKEAEKALRDALSEIEQLKDRLQAENVYLQEEIKLEHNFDEIISKSESFKKVLRKVEQVAATDATVLILGETGTGKELIARALHTLSARNARPLVKVNCAALPANLIESELFGHEKGAFTGAVARNIGRFELADGGTLFLDEIGDLSLELQSKLLRVLQEGEFERLGSSTTIKGDVRVIAATNRDLETAIEHGSFREDLYYRLNVFPIKSPPLRERKEDIPLLVNHFIKKYGAKIGKEIEIVSKNVMDALQAYDWPGNIRELENTVERALIVSSGKQLELGDWLPRTSEDPISALSNASQAATLEQNERQHILSVLEKTDWRVRGEKGAARILDINPSTLESRMRKLGIKRSQ